MTKLAKKEELLTFEHALARLETITERMNSSSVGLDESIALYEEADALITSCTKHLKAAEKKIEVLVKNRNGDLSIDAEGIPSTTALPTQE